jgi:hypothetical protein
MTDPLFRIPTFAGEMHDGFSVITTSTGGREVMIATGPSILRMSVPVADAIAFDLRAACQHIRKARGEAEPLPMNHGIDAFWRPMSPSSISEFPRSVIEASLVDARSDILKLAAEVERLRAML